MDTTGLGSDFDFDKTRRQQGAVDDEQARIDKLDEKADQHITLEKSRENLTPEQKAEIAEREKKLTEIYFAKIDNFQERVRALPEKSREKFLSELLDILQKEKPTGAALTELSTEIEVSKFLQKFEKIVSKNTENKAEYIVKKDDYLSKIAPNYIDAKGNVLSWQALHEKNREKIGDNPNLIRPDMRLEIPEGFFEKGKLPVKEEKAKETGKTVDSIAEKTQELLETCSPKNNRLITAEAFFVLEKVLAEADPKSELAEKLAKNLQREKMKLDLVQRADQRIRDNNWTPEWNQADTFNKAGNKIELNVQWNPFDKTLFTESELAKSREIFSFDQIVRILDANKDFIREGNVAKNYEKDKQELEDLHKHLEGKSAEEIVKFIEQKHQELSPGNFLGWIKTAAKLSLAPLNEALVAVPILNLFVKNPLLAKGLMVVGSGFAYHAVYNEYKKDGAKGMVNAVGDFAERMVPFYGNLLDYEDTALYWKNGQKGAAVASAVAGTVGMVLDTFSLITLLSGVGPATGQAGKLGIKAGMRGLMKKFTKTVAEEGIGKASKKVAVGAGKYAVRDVGMGMKNLSGLPLLQALVRQKTLKQAVKQVSKAGAKVSGAVPFWKSKTPFEKIKNYDSQPKPGQRKVSKAEAMILKIKFSLRLLKKKMEKGKDKVKGLFLRKTVKPVEKDDVKNSSDKFKPPLRFRIKRRIDKYFKNKEKKYATPINDDIAKTRKKLDKKQLDGVDLRKWWSPLSWSKAFNQWRLNRAHRKVLKYSSTEYQGGNPISTAYRDMRRRRWIKKVKYLQNKASQKNTNTQGVLEHYSTTLKKADFYSAFVKYQNKVFKNNPDAYKNFLNKVYDNNKSEILKDFRFKNKNTDPNFEQYLREVKKIIDKPSDNMEGVVKLELENCLNAIKNYNKYSIKLIPSMVPFSATSRVNKLLNEFDNQIRILQDKYPSEPTLFASKS